MTYFEKMSTFKSLDKLTKTANTVKLSKMRNTLFASFVLISLNLQGASAMEYKNLPNIKAPAPEIGMWETIGLIKKMLFEKSNRAPQGRMPEMKPDMNAFLKPSSSMKFVWFGHSTLLLNLDGKVLLIDPVFSNTASPFSFMIKRFQRPVLNLSQLPHIDAIVISHDHYDHLDKESILHFKNKTTQFILPKGVGEHLRDWGIPSSRIVELSWGEKVNHHGLQFTAASAQHFSGRGLFDKNETLWASWIIQGATEKIYYSGDSGYGDHFKQIGLDHGPFDVTFIENGQYNERWPDVHMQPEESLQAHLDLNGKLFVPVHWGMFDLAFHNWNEPVIRTHKLATDWEIPFLSPILGQVVDLSEETEQRQWWLELHQKKAPISLAIPTHVGARVNI
jgi:L-ascorbate metabolism protein UlaG (beta-lactamase superfamily)